MATFLFQLQPGESILFQARPNRKWYSVAWKIFFGLIEIVILTLFVAILLITPIDGFLTRFLPPILSDLFSRLLCLGLIPLIAALWVAEDIATTLIAEFILTDKRLWIKGSPYTWTNSEIPLDDIASMNFRRDSIFIRKKSTRKIQVHTLSNGKSLVETFDQCMKKPPDK